MAKNWWKALCVILLIYTVVAGFLSAVPRMAILNETVRNLYFHVPMWFGMVGLLSISLVNSIIYLVDFKPKADIIAAKTAEIAVLFGVLGLITGMFWAKFTWGAWWSNDPKQTTAAIALLIYLAYFVLRGSLDEEQERAKISSVYNIFAFAIMIPLIFILPRLVDSLHPGSGGNPGFSSYDLDQGMRLVFYPAVIGWTLLGVWIASLSVRADMIKRSLMLNGPG